MHPHYLLMGKTSELQAVTADLHSSSSSSSSSVFFLQLRAVEAYLAFFRSWLLREYQRSLRLEADELNALVDESEFEKLEFCSRLAFQMFKLCVASYAPSSSQPASQATAGTATATALPPKRVNPMARAIASAAAVPAKVHADAGLNLVM